MLETHEIAGVFAFRRWDRNSIHYASRTPMSYVFNYVASPVRNYVSSLLVSALSKYIVGIEVNCARIPLE